MSNKRMGLMLAVILAVLMACNLPSGTAPTAAVPSQIPPAVLTSVAQTVIAQGGQPGGATPSSGKAGALPPTEPPVPPTETPAPTASPTATLTPTITLTPTPSTPMVSVSVNTNCRTGPGDAYDRVGALMVGETAEVLARDPYGQFWYIPNPDRPGGKCWIWGQYATVTGDTSSLPVFTPPPTPTPVPKFVIKGVTVKSCNGGPRYFIEISNTGETVWESFHLMMLDLDVNHGEDTSGNIFVSRDNTCSPPHDVARLQPGDGAYIDGGNFAGTYHHHMRFVVTLYTKDGLHGQHRTQTVEYHP